MIPIIWLLKEMAKPPNTITSITPNAISVEVRIVLRLYLNKFRIAILIRFFTAAFSF